MTVINRRHVGTVEGFSIDAYTVPDEDTSILDYLDEDTTDAHEREIIRAFWNGDWNYVGTVVTASRCGVELGAASIWGQECGVYPIDASGNGPFVDPLDGDIETFANGYGPGLIDEAIEAARAKLAALIDEAIDTVTTTTTTTEGN